MPVYRIKNKTEYTLQEKILKILEKIRSWIIDQQVAGYEKTRKHYENKFKK